MSIRHPANPSAPRSSADFAADQSPLQQVEKIISGMSREMSKEEKRARMQEAEERWAARSSKGRSSLNSQGPRDGRYDSRYEEPYSPTETAQPQSARASTTRDDYGVPGNGTTRFQRGPTNAPAAHADLYNQASPIQASAPVDRNENRRRSDGFSPRVLTKEPQGGTRATSDSYGQPPSRQRSVREGRIFDTDPGYNDYNGNAVPTGRKSRDFPAGDSVGSKDLTPRDGVGYDSTTSSQHQSPKLKDRITGLFKRNRSSQVQPTQSGPEPRRDENNSPDQHHHLGHSRSHSSDDLRRFQPTKYADYRKDIRTARVPAVDIPTPSPATATSTNKNDIPWWDKSTPSSSHKRRTSGSRAAEKDAPPSSADRGYDRNQQQTGAQTWFQPQLYLNCGPLLRFTGIRKASRSAHEVWTGSLMIVTIDSKSSYQRPPNLRLFKQPVELLPPPPQHIDEASGQQLSPEYVDPIAGQIKMSRVGKTLYVKPVEALEEHRDLSRVEDDTGLFEEFKSSPYQLPTGKGTTGGLRPVGQDGELRGQFQDISAYILYKERGVTFWRWNLEIELADKQTRIAYRINRGPAIGFWVPARGEMMNLMFHSCNGFSLSVDTNAFSGPDPLWRDVLNSHQTRPFHLMIGGGDQIYNDAATVQTRYFSEWTRSKNSHHKHNMAFSVEMQNELELFYLNRYAMWFSQGLFGMANSQIPMVNMWDDHDIMDGFGSYPDHVMSCPVMSGVGNVAFKYYMLFQHQSLPIEDEQTEPSWLLGPHPGPFITERSRSLFMWLGHGVGLLALDCRTERARDEVLTQDTWDLVFNRLHQEVVKGQTRHLIVLLGVPIAYPRLNFLENVLTSRALDPVKALGRTGALGGFVNKFDGGVELLDDLDDHWTAKHHKAERNWFIQELQELAATKSIRITILGGDVHLAAVGQFYSKRALGLPKDEDHRYMPNVISSAIVNTPPASMVADVLNKRNKVHHLDEDTDEDMIAMFHEDVNDKARNNKHLLPRRNWCSIYEYKPNVTPPPTPSTPGTPRTPGGRQRPGMLTRAFSAGSASSLPGVGLLRRLSTKGRNSHPPIAFQQRGGEEDYFDRRRSTDQPRRSSADMAPRPVPSSDGDLTNNPRAQRNPFLRRPTLRLPDRPTHMVNLQGALDIRINCENVQGDPAGTTTDYRLIVPALDYRGPGDRNPEPYKPKRNRLTRLLSVGGGRGREQRYGNSQESISPPPARFRRPNESFDSLQPEPVPESATQRQREYPDESPTLGSNGLPVRSKLPQPQAQPQPRPVANTFIPTSTPTTLPGPPPGPPPSMRTQALPGPASSSNPATSNRRRSDIPAVLPGPPPGPPPKSRSSLPGPPPGPPPQGVSMDSRYVPRQRGVGEQKDASSAGYFVRDPRRQSADTSRAGEGFYV